jgi:hypothetical protein
MFNLIVAAKLQNIFSSAYAEQKEKNADLKYLTDQMHSL